MTQAVILAGGLGTRLRDVVSDRPKPLAEADGKPFLQYQIEQLRKSGIEQFVLCVGYGAETIRSFFGDGRAYSVRIDYAVEEELLGTAGAIRNARAFIRGSFLVLNGDSYLDFDLAALQAQHNWMCETDDKTIGTIASVSVENATAYGTLRLGNQERIVEFREKSITGRGWINAGVYMLEPGILDFIPEGHRVSIERETFPCLLSSGHNLYAHLVKGFFVDIGTERGYRKFQDYVTRGVL